MIIYSLTITTDLPVREHIEIENFYCSDIGTVAYETIRGMYKECLRHCRILTCLQITNVSAGNKMKLLKQVAGIFFNLAQAILKGHTTRKALVGLY